MVREHSRKRIARTPAGAGSAGDPSGASGDVDRPTPGGAAFADRHVRARRQPTGTSCVRSHTNAMGESAESSNPTLDIESDIDPLRRRIMQRVRRRDTGPELAVRRFLHRAGYRFRLHDRRLPGSPDLVLRKHRTVVFVHGCFWHRHPGCRRTTTPKTRRDFWQTKFAANVARDAAAIRALETLGWRVVVVWECRTRSSSDLAEALQPLLGLGAKVTDRIPA